jgi:hypothetical protein
MGDGMNLPEKAGGGTWEKAGFCSFCLMSIESQQPGGRNTRHVSTQAPLGKCPQGLKAAEADKKQKGKM